MPVGSTLQTLSWHLDFRAAPCELHVLFLSLRSETALTFTNSNAIYHLCLKSFLSLPLLSKLQVMPLARMLQAHAICQNGPPHAT